MSTFFDLTRHARPNSINSSKPQLTHHQSINGLTHFWALMSAEIFFNLAAMIRNLTLLWWVADQGGSEDLVLYSAALAASAFLTAIFLSPLSDRYPKHIVLRYCIIFCVIGSAILPGIASFYEYNLFYIIILTIITIVANTVLQPCVTSYLTELLSTDNVSWGLRIQKYANSFALIIGPGLGGLCLMWGSIAMALWLHLLMVVISLFIAIAYPFKSSVKKFIEHPSFFYDTLRGMKITWSVSVEKYWTLVSFVIAICLIPTITLLLPLKIKSMNLDVIWFGACEISFSLGALIGVAISSTHHFRNGNRLLILVLSGILQGIVMIIPAFSTTGTSLLLAFFFYGIFSNFFILAGMTHRVLARPDNYRSRMSSIVMMTMQVANVLAPLLAGFLLIYVTIDNSYLIFGLSASLFCLLYFFIPELKVLLGLSHHHANGWYASRYPHIFNDVRNKNA